MKTRVRFHHAALALLLVALNPPLAALAQGSLTPPGAPAPAMKTLAQVEPRTPIAAAPFTITNSGSYYLTANVNVTNGDAITIAASGVALDLNGFTISSTAASANGVGIYLNSGVRNLTIRNGFIQGGVTNDFFGNYTGSGFAYGILFTNNFPGNVLVSQVSVAGVLLHGIFLYDGDSTVVESCTVRTVGAYGIDASVVKNCVATDCGSTAIYGREISDCQGTSTGFGYGIAGIVDHNCHGSSSGSAGLIAFFAAHNCVGFSSANIGLECDGRAENCTGSTGTGAYGVYCGSAYNCHGSTVSGAYGLYATDLANNCTGQNGGNGYGIYASDVATDCFGQSVSGTGVYAFIVQSCRGQSSSSYGVYAFDMASLSYGASTTGIGLRAYIANSCDGSSVLIDHKYNMP